MQLSADPSTPAESLLPVPTFLFQGSILLGSLCESVLGVSASGKQLVHPFLIAGWCGLHTSARHPPPSTRSCYKGNKHNSVLVHGFPGGTRKGGMVLQGTVL